MVTNGVTSSDINWFDAGPVTERQLIDGPSRHNELINLLHGLVTQRQKIHGWTIGRRDESTGARDSWQIGKAWVPSSVVSIGENKTMQSYTAGFTIEFRPVVGSCSGERSSQWARARHFFVCSAFASQSMA